MNFETQTINKNEKPRHLPERAFLGVDRSIERLKKLESGEVRKLQYSEQERQELLQMEDKLGGRFEKIMDLKDNTFHCYPEFFLTDKGKAFFRSCCSFDIEGESVEEIRRFLWMHRAQLEKVDGKKLDDLTGASRDFSEEKTLEDVCSLMNEDGEIFLEGLKNPERASVILNPEKALEKIEQLRQFKAEIKEKLTKLEGQDGDFAKGQENILNMYRVRVNELLSENFSSVVWANQLKEEIGEPFMMEEEKQLAKKFRGMRDFVATYAKFDCFQNGVENGYDDNHNARRIGPEILRYAEELEKEYIENELAKPELAARKGLDYDKLARQETFNTERIASLAEQYLEERGLKSSESSDTYDPKRVGPAADGKWQFVCRERYTVMSVFGKQQIIKCPIKERSAEQTMSVVLGHELAGHLQQTLNQKNIPLRLYKKVFGDRRSIFAEAGAMDLQSEITEELFGYKSLPHVHYLKAMLKRLEGGTYLECAKASYDSSLKVLKLKAENEKMPKQQFTSEAKKLLKSALSRTKSIFKLGESYSSTPSQLSKSSHLVYLEQYLVMQQLKKSGLDKYAFVKGLNLNSLALLIESDLLDAEDLERPKIDYIRKIWNQEKANYQLAA